MNSTNSFAGWSATTKLFLVCIAAWVAGLCAYLGALGALYHESISRGDLGAVALWSVIAYLVCLAAIYFPVLLGLRRMLGGSRPLWPFPLVAMLSGIAPTAIIVAVYGGRPADLLSHEAVLFYAMFGAVGLVLGLGVPRLYPR